MEKAKRPNYSGLTQSERLAMFTRRNEQTGCLEWTGYRTHGGKGYGLVWYAGSKIGAHRAAYLEHVGEIPEGKYVCHSCDNPACVTPEHLWLGTSKENHKDMRDKGRSVVRRGEEHHNAKLTADQVSQILASSESRFVIAERYGVSPITIWEIRAGKKWAWLNANERVERRSYGA